MVMIAQKLTALANTALTDQHKVQKRSEKARVAEEFGEAALKLFQAPDAISDAEKIEGFDKLRQILIDNLINATRSGVRGQGFREEKDHDHWVYETAMRICFGEDIFTGYNMLSRLLGQVDT